MPIDDYGMYRKDTRMPYDKQDGSLIGGDVHGNKVEKFPHHNDPADLVVVQVHDGMMNELNLAIKALQDTFDQADYEVKYWTTRRDAAQEALQAHIKARDALVRRETNVIVPTGTVIFGEEDPKRRF